MPSLETDTTVTIEFEVFCSCGNGLCATSRVSYKRNYPQVEVEPCEKCMARAKDEGDDEGYSRGYEEGKEDVR